MYSFVQEDCEANQPDLEMQGREDGESNMSILTLPNEILHLIGTFMDASSLAAMVRAARILKDLLSKELYVKAVGFVPRMDDSVVEWAARQGQPETIRKALKQMPANTDWSRVVGTGIVGAIRYNQLEALKCLCYESPPNRASQYIRAPPPSLEGMGAAALSNNPVDLAASRGSVDVLQYLLERGMPFVTPEFPFAVSMFEGEGGKSGDTRVAELLIRHGFNTRMGSDNGQSLLHELATRGRAAHVDLLARAVPELLNIQDVDGRTPLMYAIAAKQMACARHMVTILGADVSLRKSNGVTALHMAVCEDDIDLVEALINSGADVNAQASGQVTPLHMVTDARERKTKEPLMVAILLNRGAFCSPRDGKGNTPLSYALAARNIQQVEWLMVGAVHHASEFEGVQELLDACRVGSLRIVQIYTQREGFDIERDQDQWRRSALHLAAIGGHVEVLEHLLSKWRDVDRRDVGGRTALWYACCKADSSCACQLIHAGASVDSAEHYGRTPLMNFTRHFRDDTTMSFFLKSSRKVEAVDKMGRTILHHAARHGNLAATRAIVRYQKDLVGKCAKKRQSALLFALKHDHDDVARFLRRLIILRRREFSWLAMHGYHGKVMWIKTGAGWARTRSRWIAREKKAREKKRG
ncbi:uncharacterized protein LDX57_004985 [Aspergillus melleus]|uniref:uncharacterized protein n=1 Tax=Aspergillus melleus TaxID=138277 RepID=UPI001E8E0635|nr:uncharacterized protein LDX57_004985 [Aspergillus melleus]KAH8427271.1 hypothetical protein LDX57_004985 [Aspergillus melleus]